MTQRLIDRQTCAALVITCSDFRFKTAERVFAERAALTDDYDLIARPGGVRSLVAPRITSFAASMEGEIRLLHALHAFRRVIALNHLSCRAYDDIASPETERQVHLGHLSQARHIIADRLPGVEVELCLAVAVGHAIDVMRVE